MTRYASNTEVSTDKSKAEIEKTLSRYGADEFAYAIKQGIAVVAFRMNNRRIKMVLPLPDKDSDEFRYTPSRRLERNQWQIDEAWEQACRQAWRALALVIKAKLEAVECGISDFESEFLADVMLPDGSRVADFMKPQIEEVYQTGKWPELIPGLKALPGRD
ncbi:MAG: hypothetical protein ABFD46_12280 [Armatimonadota bacterium]